MCETLATAMQLDGSASQHETGMVVCSDGSELEIDVYAMALHIWMCILARVRACVERSVLR